MLENEPEFMRNDPIFEETSKIKTFINGVDDQFGRKQTPRLKIPVEASMRKDFEMSNEKLRHY